MPFSFRPVPKKREDLKCHNDFSGLNFTLDLSTDFKEACAKTQKKTRALKTSLYPHGIRAVQEISSLLPGIIG